VQKTVREHDAQLAARLDELDARLAERLADFRRSLEDEIAAIAVRVLDSYKHELRMEYLDAGLLKKEE
jgi:hypothetical protein